jgi:hypothetical protein
MAVLRCFSEFDPVFTKTPPKNAADHCHDANRAARCMVKICTLFRKFKILCVKKRRPTRYSVPSATIACTTSYFFKHIFVYLHKNSNE